ncbi:hypothetical protein BDZ91DRAFT_851065 [Kalaharituber pfeilii]|nr:hypothetical protein BDZ91DRAFT_851065 [Kalaharituber pfeilii]
MSFVSYLDKMKFRPPTGTRDGTQAGPRGIHHNLPPSTIMVRTSSSLVDQPPSASAMDTSDDMSDSGRMVAEDEEYHDEGEDGEDTDLDIVDADEEGSDSGGYYIEGEVDESFDEERLMEKEHWSRGQLDLFAKVRARGTYPIFPAHWMLDFSNLPDELFVEPEERGLVEALNKNCEVRAILAFDALMQLGGRIRDKLESGQRVEGFVKKEMQKYIDWAMKDGDIPSTYTGVFALAASPDFEACERRMQKRMAELADRHRIARETTRQFFFDTLSQQNPSGTSDPPPSPPLQTSTASPSSDAFDIGMDVWNAITVALMVIQARDEQVERVRWVQRLMGRVEQRKEWGEMW